jgi:uncharacterized protein (TIGR02757 family)
LDKEYDDLNAEIFVKNDPIQVPYKFQNQNDIEIAAFLTASIAWGQRPVIIKNAMQLINWMGDEPFKFIREAKPQDIKPFYSFKHRTFNGTDAVYFIRALQNIYRNHGSLYNVFYSGYKKNHLIKEAIGHFRNVFFSHQPPGRTSKHVSDVNKCSTCKRLNMFLRWMVRNGKDQVDLGLWKKINPAHLYIPVDVHTGNTARKLGLINQKTNNWKAVESLTNCLKDFDPNDPAKYDLVLFNLSAK